MMHLSLAMVPPARFAPVEFGGRKVHVAATICVGEYRTQPIVVGWGIGNATADGEIIATDMCRLVAERVIALTEPETPVHIYTATKRNSLKANVRRYLEKTRPRALVILCADSQMYDDLTFILNPTWRMQ